MKALLLVSLMLIFLAAACGGGSGSSGGPDGDFERGPGASNSARPAGGGTTSAGQDAPAEATTAVFDNKLIVTTTLDLEVPDLRHAYVRISRQARDLGGYVADSRLTDSQDATTAYLRLRLPAPRHEDFVAGLRDFDGGKLQREETQAKEVTAEYTDLQSRLTNLRASEAQYRQLLGRANTIDEIIRVNAKVDEVRHQVEVAQGRFNVLEDLNVLATISVNLALPPPAARSPDSRLPTPGEVLVDAARVSFVGAWIFANFVVVLAVASAWLVPLTAMGLVTWKMGRRWLPALKSWLE